MTTKAAEIIPFADAQFCICWHGECSESRIVIGWENVLNYIDDQTGGGPDEEYTVHSPCCELHDADNWLLLDDYLDDDQRHYFHSSEFVYCVGLSIIRITQAIHVESQSGPTVAQMLAAAPMLQWRKCRGCGNVNLHVENVAPWVACPRCGSMDTRQLRDESRALQEQAG